MAAHVIDIHDPDTVLKVESGFFEMIANEYVYVDLQGFKLPGNGFMCKEFCLLDDNDYVFHAFFKSAISFEHLPSFYKRQAIWLMNNHHKIDYNYGDTDPSVLCEQVYPKIQNKIVLVKGLEKTHWMKQMFRDYGEIKCMDVNSLNFEAMSKQADSYNVCDYHNQVSSWTKGPCAKATAMLVRDLAHKNINSLP